MTISSLTPHDLRVSIAPDTLGFSDTSELLHHPLPWIGQARAETAARFGLGIAQPDYNLFVLGEVGSGRSSLLQFKAESEHIEKTYKVEESKAFAELDAFAEARSLPKDRRSQIDKNEQELRIEITRFLDQTRPLSRVMNEGLVAGRGACAGGRPRICPALSGQGGLCRELHRQS